MKFTWKCHIRMLLLGMFLSLVGACSSSQEQQEELTLQQEMGQQGEAAEADMAEGQEAYQQGEAGMDSEESEEALSQNQNSVGEGEYANAEVGAEESYNTANDNELESLMADDSSPEAIEELTNDSGLVADDSEAVENFSQDSNMENLAVNETTNVIEEAVDQPVEEAALSAPVAQAGQGLPEMGSKMSYVVQRGETLSIIAQNIYGNMEKWREISTLTGMENPNRIYPGDVVYYQLSDATLAFATAYENTQRGEVTVNSGDTLASIAKNVYGDQGQWKSVWRQNDQIGNPDRLEVGQVVYFVNLQAVMAQKELIQSEMAKMESAPVKAEVSVSVEALEKEVEALESLTMLDLDLSLLTRA